MRRKPSTLHNPGGCNGVMFDARPVVATRCWIAASICEMRAAGECSKVRPLSASEELYAPWPKCMRCVGLEQVLTVAIRPLLGEIEGSWLASVLLRGQIHR